MVATGLVGPSRASRRRRARAARLLVVVSVACGVVSVAVLARAFWTQNGTGGGTVGVGSLPAPGSVVAAPSPGSTTVPVTWTSASAPDGGAVTGYYVERVAGGISTPACSSSPSALIAAGATSCNDLNVPDGTYTYTSTAVYRSWTARSAASAAVPVVGVSSFVVSAPASTTAATAFTVTVTAKAASNQTITGYVGTVHFATSDLNGSVPADYRFVPADNGVHTFTNGVVLDTAPSQGVAVNDVADVTKTGSATVTVTVGAPAQLGFTQQPGGGTAAVAWGVQPKVAIRDAGGNTVTTSTASVTLAITSGTGTPGGVLTCTANPKAAVAGVVSFAGCKITLPGAGYTLTATATGLGITTSSAFGVVPGAPTKVVYTQQPTGVIAGSAINPAVLLAVEDVNGNIVTSSSATVTIAISTNPGGGTLSGTLAVNATNGVAAFPDLSIDRSASSYRLTASSPGLTSATSGTFNVTAGAGVQLTFTQQPGGGTGGVAWPTQPKVAIQDALGNTVTSDSASVTLAVTAGTGDPGGVVICTTNPRSTASGVATFAGCKINVPGIDYTVTATAAGLVTDVSTTFDIVVGPATKIVYTQQPTAVVAGSLISPAVELTVQDAGGNTVVSSSASISIAISTNPGGGTLSGTLTVGATNGVSVFPDLWINRSGTGYKLTATSTSLTSAASSAFNVVVGAPAQLGFTQQPGGGAAGAAWATQPKVAIQDAFGNTVTTSSANVTLSITSGTGQPGGVLTCTANPKATSSGVASFTGCKINLASSGYSLTATAAGLTAAISSPFTIS